MIPTAEEFKIIKYSQNIFNDSEIMIEFAKLHVEAALKEASNVLNVDNDGDYINHPTKELIISSYSLENIK